MQTETTTSVRRMREADLAQADRIMRLAFGTFLGASEPETFMGDAEFVRPRFMAYPDAAFVAEVDGDVGGSNFATNWGSFGFFGPLTVRPDLWDRGIGKRLMEPVLERFDAWNITHGGLFTFAESEKHVGFYQRFDFWPQYLTAMMGKRASGNQNATIPTLFSMLSENERDAALAACREVTEQILEGLDLEAEIRAVVAHKFGDVVLLWGDSKLDGLAVCHTGAGSESGSGACYVKFAAVRPGSGAHVRFTRLLDGVERYASSAGASTLLLGVNTGRHEAYRLLLEQGFKTRSQGVAMQRGNQTGYNRSGMYIIDDWR